FNDFRAEQQPAYMIDRLDAALNSKDGIAQATIEDCVTVGENRVEFNNCELSDVGGAFTINGYIAASEGSLEVDIAMNAEEFEGGRVRMFLRGAVTASATAIAGRLDMGFDLSAEGFSVKVDAAVVYDVQLEGDCAVGGDIKVGVSASASGGGQSETRRAMARA